jgi:hypothetical protein
MQTDVIYEVRQGSAAAIAATDSNRQHMCMLCLHLVPSSAVCMVIFFNLKLGIQHQQQSSHVIKPLTPPAR